MHITSLSRVTRFMILECLSVSEALKFTLTCKEFHTHNQTYDPEQPQPNFLLSLTLKDFTFTPDIIRTLKSNTKLRYLRLINFKGCLKSYDDCLDCLKLEIFEVDSTSCYLTGEFHQYINVMIFNNCGKEHVNRFGIHGIVIVNDNTNVVNVTCKKLIQIIRAGDIKTRIFNVSGPEVDEYVIKAYGYSNLTVTLNHRYSHRLMQSLTVDMIKDNSDVSSHLTLRNNKYLKNVRANTDNLELDDSFKNVRVLNLNSS